MINQHMEEILKYFTTDAQGALRFNNQGIGTGSGGGLSLTPEQVADLQQGVKVIAAVLKLASGEVVLDTSLEMLEEYAPDTVAYYLGDDQPWGNITGKSSTYILVSGLENRTGQLGQKGQQYEMNGTLYVCISHVLGTPGFNDGSAVWIRVPSVHSLRPGFPTDDAQISQLEDNTGWDIHGRKVVTARGRKGTSYYSVTTGYRYECYDDTPESWSWFRTTETLNYDELEIDTARFTHLLANLVAHDYSSGFYDESSDPANEPCYQGAEYWDEASGKFYKRNKNGKWFRLINSNS